MSALTGRLLARVIESGQAGCIAASNEPAPNASFSLPSALLLLLSPLRQHSTSIGVVEIAQRVVENELARQNYLRLLERLCEPAGRFLEA